MLPHDATLSPSKRSRRRMAARARTPAWGLVYRATSYLESALWTVPLVAIGLVLTSVPLLRRIDDAARNVASRGPP